MVYFTGAIKMISTPLISIPGESGDKMTTVEGGVKAERLSPGSSGGPGAESGSSRSGTPSSSCTPPRGSPARAYSDFMRSLAAKYNTSAEYPSLRNGLTASTKPPFLLGAKDEVLPSFSPFAAPIFPPAPVIDMNATQALLNMVRTHQQGTQLDSYLKGSGKREAANAPLDLSASAPPPAKRSRKTLSESLYGTDVLPLLRATTPRPKRPSPRKKCASLCADKPCAPDSQSVSHWTVEDVAAFVSSLDMCAEYAPNFREQRIDGSSLPLLTEDHLTTRLGMRLGPALRLRSLLSSRLGQCPSCLHCVHCHQPPDK